jgi:hypothetical protein
MGHKAHIRLIYPHAEGIGANHHPYIPLLPRRLPLASAVTIQSGMIEIGAYTLPFQKCGLLFTTLAATHIHYARALHPSANIQQLPALVFRLAHDIIKVRPLETAFQHQLFFEAELFHHIIGNLRSGGGGKGYHGCLHEFADIADLQIIGTEIVTPLRYAMRLIDNDIIDVKNIQIALEKRGRKPFGRHIQKLTSAISGIIERQIHLMPLHPGMHCYGMYPPLLQALHLVFHQRNQRGYHQRSPLGKQGRHLKADALASSGWKDRQHITPLKRCRNYFLLHRPEALIAPIFL